MTRARRRTGRPSRPKRHPASVRGLGHSILNDFSRSQKRGPRPFTEAEYLHCYQEKAAMLNQPLSNGWKARARGVLQQAVLDGLVMRRTGATGGYSVTMQGRARYRGTRRALRERAVPPAEKPLAMAVQLNIDVGPAQRKTKAQLLEELQRLQASIKPMRRPAPVQAWPSHSTMSFVGSQSQSQDIDDDDYGFQGNSQSTVPDDDDDTRTEIDYPVRNQENSQSSVFANDDDASAARSHSVIDPEAAYPSPTSVPRRTHTFDFQRAASPATPTPLHRRTSASSTTLSSIHSWSSFDNAGPAAAEPAAYGGSQETYSRAPTPPPWSEFNLQPRSQADDDDETRTVIVGDMPPPGGSQTYDRAPTPAGDWVSAQELAARLAALEEELKETKDAYHDKCARLEMQAEAQRTADQAEAQQRLAERQQLIEELQAAIEGMRADHNVIKAGLEITQTGFQNLAQNDKILHERVTVSRGRSVNLGHQATALQNFADSTEESKQHLEMLLSAKAQADAEVVRLTAELKETKEKHEELKTVATCFAARATQDAAEAQRKAAQHQQMLEALL